jgi:hypothetical protein
MLRNLRLNRLITQSNFLGPKFTEGDVQSPPPCRRPFSCYSPSWVFKSKKSPDSNFCTCYKIEPSRVTAVLITRWWTQINWLDGFHRFDSPSEKILELLRGSEASVPYNFRSAVHNCSTIRQHWRTQQRTCRIALQQHQIQTPHKASQTREFVISCAPPHEYSYCSSAASINSSAFPNTRPPLWSSGQSSWLHNGDVLWFLWGTNWIYICYAEESRPPLWSSGQSSWLHNGDVLWFLWGTNWIYIYYVEESKPPLWSSGQSSWLQIRRSGFDSRHYQKKKEVALERGPQPREYNWGATW